MKKVLALVLAVMMLATVAMAAAPTQDGSIKYQASVAPNGSVKVSQDGISAGATHVTVTSVDGEEKVVEYTPNSEGVMDSGEATSRAALDYGVEKMLFRAVTNENYAVTSLKVPVGRSLVKGVTINDKEERVEVKFVDDLNNTTAKSWDLSFTLKGKAKMILKDDEEALLYTDYTGNEKEARERVTIPSVKFTMSGTVGYGKVEIFLGDDNDEDLTDIGGRIINRGSDVVKFSTGNDIGDYSRIAGYPVAGSFTADAILTENYGQALTLEARVYGGDVLFFDCDNDPDRDVIGRLADSDADMDFYVFNSDKKFTTFNSNAKLYFNDAGEEDFVYQIKDDKSLVKVGSYSEDDGCWVVKTRTLGAYVVSDVELKEFEAAAGSESNPDTGANDVVGIATALAAVALVSAAAVSLKK